MAHTIAHLLITLALQGLPRLEAQMLMLHACGRDTRDRAWLLAHDDQHLSGAQLHTLNKLVQRRLAGEPMAYITGTKEFFGLALQVDARVLDPRDDTETLVEWALELLPAQHSARVVDLGTGSGAVALALRSQRPQIQVLGVDASVDALEVARSNGQRLGLPVQWVHGHWLDGVPVAQDLIVSNPPYIAQGDPHLAALSHEPLSALTSGTDGLDDIRTIVAQAPAHLVPGGWLLLEHGHEQAQAVRALLQTRGFAHVSSRRDLAGVERCSGGQRR